MHKNILFLMFLFLPFSIRAQGEPDKSQNKSSILNMMKNGCCNFAPKLLFTCASYQLATIYWDLSQQSSQASFKEQDHFYNKIATNLTYSGLTFFSACCCVLYQQTRGRNTEKDSLSHLEAGKKLKTE